MSQCEKKSMALQMIKDKRSKIRRCMVTRKQGDGDESEDKEGKLGKDPEMGVYWRKGRSGEDPGKIHRSIGVQCSGVLGVGRSWG